MSYIRSKMVHGCGPYYYEVRSIRQGKTVRQECIRYIGKFPLRPQTSLKQLPLDRFAQVENIEAVKTKPPRPLTPRPEIFARPPSEMNVEELPSKAIARCIKDTRKLAQKLRDYDAATEQSLQELADKLKALQHIEVTTDDNEELNRVNAEILGVKKHLEELGKMSPEAIRAEFKELMEKCHGVSVRLSKHSDVIRFHFKANATESQSLVVRDDAKQLYEQLLKKRRE